MHIYLKKLSDDAVTPQQMKSGAGADLYSVESYTLYPWERKLFKTNIAVAIPEGYYGRIAPRSSLALKWGIDVLWGVIDANYRGDIGVILINLWQEDFTVEKWMRIAQCIITPYVSGERQETDDLDTTVRWASWFGSTGV